jgi:hypothetical protein
MMRNFSARVAAVATSESAPGPTMESEMASASS